MDEVGRKKGKVCVTGGTGYVASWLIMRLLQLGYSVNTTVREVKKDVSYLTSLPGASERLQIFKADLDDPESFQEPIQGCDGVFHLAHPLEFVTEETQENLNHRAINGTLGVLQACLNSKTVKRVVLTSTCGAVLLNGKTESEKIDESSWSDVEFIEKNFKDGLGPYFISKTVTEKAAMDFAMKNGIEMVTINPTYISGPFLCPTCPLSVRLSMAMIFGGDLIQYRSLITVLYMVHIDDVVDAHIYLLENIHAKGRYICSSIEIPIQQLADFLLKRYPELKINKSDFLEGTLVSKYPSPTSKKLLDSGFKFKHGLEEMYDETIECCKKMGFL